MRASAGALALAFAVAAPAGGAELLRGDLRPLVPAVRAGAPIPVDASLDWSGEGILEGHLDIELADGVSVYGRHKTADMALTTGSQSFRLLLPPPHVESPGQDQRVNARMRFVTAVHTYDLVNGALPMRIGAAGSAVVGLCRERSGGLDEERDVLASLRVESVAGEADIYDGGADRTFFSRWSAEDLPAQPLAYCAFDLLYLSPESLLLLKGRQADAIARWVAAGGSLCLGEDASSREAVQALVRTLLATAGQRADVAGAHVAVGLGRCAIVDSGAIPAETRDFLWNVSPARLDASAQEMRSRHNYAQNALQFDHECASLLVRALMPTGVQPVPIGALALILAGLLIAVGPADYWALGLLRLRRFTWLLFPVVVAATTFAVIALANQNLGRHHRSRSLTLVDVGGDGRALRSNRFEVLFAGRRGTLELPLRDALWAEPQTWNAYAYGVRRYGAGREPAGGGRVCTRGAFPMRYTASLPVEQWMPTLHQTLTLQSDPAPIPIAWDAVDAAYLRSGADICSIRDRVLPKGARKDVRIALVRGRFSAADSPQSPPVDAVQRLTAGIERVPASAPCPAAPGVWPGLQRLALGASQGDATPVLAVIIPEGENYRVFRRRYDER